MRINRKLYKWVIIREYEPKTNTAKQKHKVKQNLPWMHDSKEREINARFKSWSWKTKLHDKESLLEKSLFHHYKFIYKDNWSYLFWKRTSCLHIISRLGNRCKNSSLPLAEERQARHGDGGPWCPLCLTQKGEESLRFAPGERKGAWWREGSKRRKEPECGGARWCRVGSECVNWR